MRRAVKTAWHTSLPASGLLGPPKAIIGPDAPIEQNAPACGVGPRNGAPQRDRVREPGQLVVSCDLDRLARIVQVDDGRTAVGLSEHQAGKSFASPPRRDALRMESRHARNLGQVLPGVQQ